MAKKNKRTEFDILYETVFDSKGIVKSRKSQEYLALIKKCEEISKEPCGDKTRAFMYLRKIKRIYHNYKSGLYGKEI